MSIIRLSALIASFTLGILVGSAAVNLISGAHLDYAELEIQKLNTKLADQSEQITALEQNLAKRQKSSSINEIDIRVSFKETKPANEYDKLGIEKSVKKLLRDVRGKEVSSVDPLLITNIIDRRTVESSNRKFLLVVKGTLISEKLIMYVEASQIQQEQSADR